MRPIGRLRTCFPDKFGVPRQPGMVPAAWGRLVFREDLRRPEAVKGLEGFSHLWVLFLFDGVKEQEVRLQVRPPRLGGNEKRGVYATRSPFRPNRIGLSVCKLEAVDLACDEGPVLELSGVDVVDGTPVLDVKPYLPYADTVEGAVGGFAAGRPEAREVLVGGGLQDDFAALPERLQELIRQTLRWDPRPAFHDQDRRYFLRLEHLDVGWEVRDGACVVVALREAGA